MSPTFPPVKTMAILPWSSLQPSEATSHGCTDSFFSQYWLWILVPSRNRALVSEKLKNVDNKEEMMLSACLLSEGRWRHFSVPHWNLLEIQWISKLVGKACLLLVKQKRPMCGAFTASISQGISNESELTLVFKSKIWLWLSNASYI